MSSPRLSRAAFRGTDAFRPTRFTLRCPLVPGTAAPGDSIPLRKQRTALANRGFAPLSWGTRNLRVVSTAFKGGFQEHGCVPLDEIYLTVPLSPRNGSSGRFDPAKETTHCTRKLWICASDCWDSAFACQVRTTELLYVTLVRVFFLGTRSLTGTPVVGSPYTPGGLGGKRTCDPSPPAPRDPPMVLFDF